MRDFDQSWRSRLADLSGQGRLRQLAESNRLPDGRIERDGIRLLDFSSNDYLGLTRHPAVKARAADYLERWGAGSAASRLVTGNIPPYTAIEAKLAAGKGAEAALVLASGFQANSGLLPALLDATLWSRPPLVLADKLNHASLLQGVAAAGSRQVRFRHNDMGHLEDLLVRHAGEGPCFIVTETVFSMDGDRADLESLVELANRYDAFLYLDEAHATGVLGPGGMGLAHGLASSNCLVMGTFSKGMGSFGAYAACSATLKEYLVNRCAGLIYATALPPATLGAIEVALDLVPGMDEERAHLAGLAEDFRARLRAAGEDCGASSTQIVPLITGSERAALDLAAALKQRRMLAIAIRPPTVPPGASRLRFAFAAHHTAEDVAQLAQALTLIREAA